MTVHALVNESHYGTDYIAEVHEPTFWFDTLAARDEVCVEIYRHKDGCLYEHYGFTDGHVFERVTPLLHGPDVVPF